MIPIRTSLTPRRTPYANYTLIAINAVVFLLSYYPTQTFFMGQRVIEPLRSWAQPMMLSPEHPFLWQFVTYAFLHSGWMHIIGNMYFLYVFGNNVNDKLGNIGYLCFYLAGGVFSGLGHTLLHQNPVLGASGAVAAVTGAYLVLFPQTVITVLYFLFYFMDTIEIKALWFILFKLIVWDNMVEPNFSVSAVAYDAHLAGYFFGILCVLLLLGIKLIEPTHLDLWSMIRQWNRRRVFRDSVSDGYSPFEPGRVKKPVNATVVSSPVAENPLRAEVNQAFSSKNMPQAAQLYVKLLQQDGGQCFPRQQQLDLANQLMADGQWASAGAAYEIFLAQYANYEFIEQVQLMLGLLYTRYLSRPDKARQLLGQAKEKLTQESQVRMCEALLGELDGQSGKMENH